MWNCQRAINQNAEVLCISVYLKPKNLEWEAVNASKKWESEHELDAHKEKHLESPGIIDRLHTKKYNFQPIIIVTNDQNSWIGITLDAIEIL